MRSSCSRRLAVRLIALGCLCSTAAGRAEEPGRFDVQPAEVTLAGNFAQAQLLVSAVESDGTPTKHSADLTSKAKYASSDPKIVSVNESGRLLARGDGTAQCDGNDRLGSSHEVPVTVSGVLPQPQLAYLEHVVPILSKAGCNAGACHASQYGKGGFKLTVFSFDPNQDYAQIVRDREGRRIDRVNPENSLLLLKPTLAVPHGGNQRLEAGSIDHQMLVSLAGRRRPRSRQQGRQGDRHSRAAARARGPARLHAAVAGHGHLQRRPREGRHRLGPLRQHGRRRGRGHARRDATRPSAAGRRR